MKNNLSSLLILVLFISGSGCLNKRTPKAPVENRADTSTVTDTGYTGIKKYYSKSYLVKEVTFKNGIRQGLMKTYYLSGKLYQTFWYENGVREDTAKWYYEDGKIFRKTPFKKDTIDGTQVQYYENGVVKARLSYADGVRTTLLEEFKQDGSKIFAYPEMVIKREDNYKKEGIYKIYLELNKKDVKVSFYRGEFVNGLFMPKKYTKLNINEFKGYLELKKSNVRGESFVGIIAEITTDFGNKYLTNKKIDLPYNDLK